MTSATGTLVAQGAVPLFVEDRIEASTGGGQGLDLGRLLGSCPVPDWRGSGRPRPRAYPSPPGGRRRGNHSWPPTRRRALQPTLNLIGERGLRLGFLQPLSVRFGQAGVVGAFVQVQAVLPAQTETSLQQGGTARSGSPRPGNRRSRKSRKSKRCHGLQVRRAAGATASGSPRHGPRPWTTCPRLRSLTSGPEKVVCTRLSSKRICLNQSS